MRRISRPARRDDRFDDAGVEPDGAKGSGGIRDPGAGSLALQEVGSGLRPRRIVGGDKESRQEETSAWSQQPNDLAGIGGDFIGRQMRCHRDHGDEVELGSGKRENDLATRESMPPGL